MAATGVCHRPSVSWRSAITRALSVFVYLALLTGCSTPRSLNGVGPGGGEKLVIGEAFSLHSELLGERRAYSVYLPRSYDSPYLDKAYPVLYLLDGNVHFQMASGVVAHMSPHQTPEMIVVGIDNSLHRTRDLSPTQSMVGPYGDVASSDIETGGGDAFLGFVRNELMPQIEGRYRTSNQRVIVGHSAGGLLAMHALLSSPELFDGYIAIDPSLWWDDRLLVKEAREAFVDGHGRTASVFISHANEPRPRGRRLSEGDPPKEAIRSFIEVLEGARTPEFQFSSQYFEDENHGSVPLVSLYAGLRKVFDDHPDAGGR